MEKIEQLQNNFNLRRDGNSLWGDINSYGFIIMANSDGENLVTKISFNTKVSDENLVEYMDTLKFEEIISSYEMKEWGVIVYVNYLGFSEDNSIGTLYLDITDKLHELKLGSLCPNCMEVKTPAFVKISNNLSHMCHECITNIEDKIFTEFKKPNNYLMGGLGALLGGIIGSVVWIIIGLVGFYASIAGYLIAFCSNFGYQIFGGKKTKTTAAILGLSILLSMIFAQYMGVMIDIVKSYDNVTILNAISLTPQLLQDSEFLYSLIPGMGLGLLFAALGSRKTIKELYETKKRVEVERV